MKKTFLFAALAAGAVFAGCQDQTDIEKMNGNGIEIGFRTLTDKTRATVVDGNNIGSFKVSAIWNDPKAAPTAFNHMDGINVTRAIGGGSTWSYNPIKYWPDAGNGDVDFYAYSPAGSVNVSKFESNGTNATITYKVPLSSTDSKKAEDFLVSKAEAKTYVAPGQVPLTFEHALSLVTFSAKNVSTGATFCIEAVELINLDQDGTLNLAAATWNWTLTGTKNKTYKAGLPTAGVTVLPEGTSAPFRSLLGPNEGMMVLPQAITAGAGTDTTPKDNVPDDIATAGKGYVKVTYRALDQVGAIIRPTGSTAYFKLAQTLAPKTAYDFRLTLGGSGEGGGMGMDLNPISFSVGVATWPAATARPL